jgi:hypothetical protein
VPRHGPVRGTAGLNRVGGGKEPHKAVLDVAERLGRGQEGLQRRKQLCWGGFVRVVPRLGDLHGHRVGDTFGEGVVVLWGDGFVVGAPGDQQRDLAE